MNEWYLLSLGVLLTIGTGIFVASEFSLINLERTELEARQERGERGLAASIRALKRTSTHLSGAQLGITLTTMLTGFLAEPSLAKILEPTLEPLGLSSSSVHGTALVLALIVATLFSTLLGELIPKKLALTIPLGVNKAVVRFQLIFTWVFGWLIWLLNKTGNSIVRSLGIEPKEELSSSRTADELSSLVKRSASLGALEQSTADLITKTLALSQLVAADVMTPRTKLTSLDASLTVQDVIQLSHNTGFSRFPVFTGSTDDVVGIVHVKAAASVPREKRNSVPVTALMVEPFRVPETISLEKLMGVLRSHGLQLAIVVDEYGGTAGIVTLEDLVEELVGELGDEHDRAKLEITGGKDKSFSFPGMFRPDELLEKLAIKVPVDGAYETVAGYLMSVLGRVAVVGDEVRIEDGLLRVERMDGRRVDRIRFIPDEISAGGEQID
ncbi:MAG: HlyC/CorC family transporter [Micrococcales bacterium]|jgi:CBS domain containing-hemolysin-like protein|nr:HlyC/CorC family transporter [Actinomycetota bacterium]NCA07585.1 HlyC/CorC family transporter [Micrococcales bacterium]